jgi:2-keto-4-pentenoate hydratase
MRHQGGGEGGDMWSQDKARQAAEFMWRGLVERRKYQNLPDELAPGSADQAYDAQEAFHALASKSHGPIAGMKIATTTKVMQRLMGIDHPCGGAIFAKRIHAAPARIRLADHMHLVAECEIAVRLGADLARAGNDVEPAEAMRAVADVAPAFELIEDRNAVYTETRAWSLVADNSWNAGIVVGDWVRFDPSIDTAGLEGVLTIDGAERGRGKPDDPFGALAWLANLARHRNRPLRAGMIVITGSLIATFPLTAGSDVVFELPPWGNTRMRVE